MAVRRPRKCGSKINNISRSISSPQLSTAARVTISWYWWPTPTIPPSKLLPLKNILLDVGQQTICLNTCLSILAYHNSKIIKYPVPVPVYCHMTSSGIGACGGSGWSLAMKIDGEKVIYLP